jgi:hypothetical protein
VEELVLAAVSLVVIVLGGAMVLRAGTLRAPRGRLGLAVLAVGVLTDPWLLEVAARWLWVHAVVVVVGSLWVGVAAFAPELLYRHERIADRGRLGQLALAWIWPLVVVQDVLLWVGFQDGFEHAARRDPVWLALLLVAEAAVGLTVIYVLSGDGHPRVSHIRQVFIAWSSAMVIMALGVSLGLSGPWFGFYATSAAALHQEAEQQLAAAIFVILGGAPWFLIGTQKMRLWLESEERESWFSRPRFRVGRSVRIGPGRPGQGR